MTPNSSHSASISAVLKALEAGLDPDPAQLRDAVRALLARLRAAAPGRSVEVRVPPYGAIQCIAGPTHTRGTPPNVIEATPSIFVRLAAGRISWADALAEGSVHASGIRADLSGYLPVWWPPSRPNGPH